MSATLLLKNESGFCFFILLKSSAADLERSWMRHQSGKQGVLRGGRRLHLNAVVAEKEARVGSGGHLQARGAAPHWRLPDQEGEGAALTALVALAEYVCTDKTGHTHARWSAEHEQLVVDSPWARFSNVCASSFMASLFSVSLSSLESSRSILQPPRALRTDSPA